MAHALGHSADARGNPVVQQQQEGDFHVERKMHSGGD
jgi:hypothetical protein